MPGVDTSILLIDPSGLVLLNTRVPQGDKVPAVISLVNPLRREAALGATIVSNMYYAPVGKQHSFSIQIPVLRKSHAVFSGNERFRESTAKRVRRTAIAGRLVRHHRRSHRHGRRTQ